MNTRSFSIYFLLGAAVAVSGCGGNGTAGPRSNILSNDAIQTEAPAVSDVAVTVGENTPNAVNFGMGDTNTATNVEVNGALSSVTQSSNDNVANSLPDRATTDTVRIINVERNAEGAVMFNVDKSGGGGRAWAVTQEDSVQIAENPFSDFDGFGVTQELDGPPGGEPTTEDATDDGTLYVNFYTDIEQGIQEPVTTLGTPINVPAGTTIPTPNIMSPRITLVNVPVDGTFPDPSTGEVLNGQFSCSTSCVLNDNVAESSTWIFTPRTTTTPTTQDSDWLAGGVWLYIPDDTEGQADDFEIGAFVGGKDPFTGANLAGVTGNAIYDGEATGIYTVVAADDTGEVGSFDATVRLEANFDTNRISGGLREVFINSPVDGRVGSTGTLMFDAAVIPTASNTPDGGFFSNGIARGQTLAFGEASMFTTDTGKWGGQFFGDGTASTDAPGSVAGTFAVEGSRNDDTASLIGVFGANLQATE